VFLREFLRAPSRLLVLFLLLTLLPVSVLVWLGWQFIGQDRIVELQVQERREKAADLIVASLQHALAQDEQRLLDPSAWRRLAKDGGHVIVIRSQKIETYPETFLSYYPQHESLPEAPTEVFEAGEDDEFKFQNYAAAIGKFRRLVGSPDAAIRAGATLRLARNLRKAGKLAAALEVYGGLARENGVALFGIPADLVGRHARCLVLAELNRSTELRREAVELLQDLREGRWRLRPGAYLHYAGEVAQWLGVAGEAELNWTVVIEPLWEKWTASKHGSTAEASGREIFQAGDETYVLLWRSDASGLTAFAAGSAYVKKHWLSEVDGLLASQDLRLNLYDPQDHVRVGESGAERLAEDARLPWTVGITERNRQAAGAKVAARRRLLLAGLALITIVVSASSYFAARAVTRELALARLQSEFVDAVSHEFRTPLTALSQSAEILNDGRITDPDRLRVYYQAQTRATTRLQRLVESLLDFGRMEAGKKPYQIQKLDATALVRAVVEEFRAEPAAAGHTVELDLNPKAFPIDGDPEALGHALRNLLDNAVKYSPECPIVGVEVKEIDGLTAISIRDQGMGIPHAEQKEIFRKFVRGKEATANGIKGTGVGLAMVEHIVKAHGGEIRLNSEPGKGSTFTVLLRPS
jgi:signal transduction histidine kinase